MVDVVSTIRQWLGLLPNSAEQEAVEKRLEAQERRIERLVRLARTDAEIAVTKARQAHK